MAATVVSFVVPAQGSCRAGIAIGEEVAAQMARRVGEQVEVRTVLGDQDDAPMSFLWRGRLYVVREVLDHWCDRRAWWTTAAARALHGDEPSMASGGVSGSRAAVREAVDQDCEVWRVQASAGRTYSSGVYDLSREPSADPLVGAGAWRLLQVAD